MRFDRRSFIKTTAAFAVAAPAVFRITKVQGAEFSMKYANNTAATHPLSIRTKEAIDAITKETGGRSKYNNLLTASLAPTRIC